MKNWDKLTLDERKAAFDNGCCGGCCKKDAKPCCKGEKPGCKGEGHGSTFWFWIPREIKA